VITRKVSTEKKEAMTDNDGSVKDVQVVKISKDNYNRWRIEIRDALEGQGLWSYVDGSTVNPEDSATNLAA